MFCSAARYSRKLKPTVHQTVAITMAHIATEGSFSQATGGMPRLASKSLNSPSSGLYIQAKKSETTVEASRNGEKKESRHSHCAGRPMLTSAASAKAITTSGTVLISVKYRVFPSERHMSESANASV